MKRYAAEPEAPKHRRSRKGPKPWALQLKGKKQYGGWRPFADWTTLRRYRTKEDAMKGLSDVARKHPDLWEARAVGPDETVYPDGTP